MKKNILLIGGSYGIGHETVKQLHQSHTVYVASRTSENLSGLNVHHIPFDVATDKLDLTQLPESIDGFAYFPGSINLRPFKGLRPEIFEKDFRINVLSMIQVLQDILPKLLASEQASVVLYSTVAVKVGMPFHTSVAAAKGAIEGFAKSLAAEYAPKLRVNVIAPSLTHTPLADKFLNNDIKKEKAAQRHPLKRAGEATDVAAMTSFLLGNESNWMTGQIVGVDGGISTLNTGN
ncbi:MAG: SDR family NAD(P)-dependent oxidoreductase [Flavobacteriaceae bacterium]|nr:SDR family NAD(P)-dependent oxidoreductase [Flavobacteriaceae bacterium]